MVCLVPIWTAAVRFEHVSVSAARSIGLIDYTKWSEPSGVCLQHWKK